jgi:signal transduction histidine kinase
VFSTEARKLDIALTLEFGPGVDRYGSFIFTDPVRLGQVVTNLLNNAIRFTQTSDVRQIKVTIDLCLDPPSDDSCMVPVEPTDKQWAHGQQIFVYASFQDSGPGLVSEDRRSGLCGLGS